MFRANIKGRAVEAMEDMKELRVRELLREERPKVQIEVQNYNSL